MANMTVTTAANFIPELWLAEVLEAAEFGEVLQTRINRRWESAARHGDTVHVPRLSNNTANDKAADTDVSFEAITEGKQDLTIATHKYAAFVVEDIVEVQSNQDLRGKQTKKLGYALTRAREVSLTALAQNFSQIVGALGVELVSDDYLRAWQYLADAGLLEMSPDAGEDFSTVLSPAAYAGALKVDVFANRQYNPEANAVQRAHIGDIYGMPVFISNLLRAPAGGQHEAMMFHREGMAAVIQKGTTVISDMLIEKIGFGVVAHTIYGVTEVNFPPETAGGGTAVDNRDVLLRTV